MRQELVGYVLGALDDSEHQQVEDQIATNDHLQRELHLVHRAIEPLAADKRSDRPPEGLAQRTCQLVQDHNRPTSLGSALSAAQSASQPSLAQTDLLSVDRPTRSHRWGLIDAAVAAGILAAATVLLFPAISHSRFQAQITSCQNKLAELGRAIQTYSEQNNGTIPAIDQRGSLAVAGIYAPRLLQTGLISDPKTFVCGGSEMACSNAEIEIPSYNRLVELETSDRSRLDEVLENVGGSYAYNLGYREKGVYKTVSLSDCNSHATVLMADAPCRRRQWSQSSNHGGYGQNVLYADGKVHYLTNCRSPGCIDTDIYHNDHGEIAAGTHRYDVVVGCSATRPCGSERN